MLLVLAKLSEKKPGLTRQRALPQNWMGLPIGYSGIHLECAFHGRPRNSLEVGLHFERASAEENEKLLAFFNLKRAEMADELKGHCLEFQFPWWKKWARIYEARNIDGMSNELADWAVDTVTLFYDVFKPRLDKFIPGLFTKMK